jgi:acyl carrier protein
MEERIMTFEKIAELIAENKDMELSDITLETSFEDMELDSLDVIEVVMSIEEAFGITLEIEDNVKTVGDLVDLVDSLVE